MVEKFDLPIKMLENSIAYNLGCKSIIELGPDFNKCWFYISWIRNTIPEVKLFLSLFKCPDFQPNFSSLTTSVIQSTLHSPIQCLSGQTLLLRPSSTRISTDPYNFILKFKRRTKHTVIIIIYFYHEFQLGFIFIL